jgi:predicted nucleic acid-binding protein
MRGGTEALVLDASVVVDLLLGTDVAREADRRMRRHGLHAPAHIDIEVLSALGRLTRDGQLDQRAVPSRLRALAVAPISRHPLPPLLMGSWRRRQNLRLTDALYVELAVRLDAVLITSDQRLARTTARAELVTG